MKKYIVFLLCAIMLVSLFSCESNEDQNKDNSKQVSENEMYAAVLRNDIPVYEVCGANIEEPCYLKDFKTPYSKIPLCEMETLEYVYMDVDGDGTLELLIHCDDTLILRYYEGAVYVYPFAFRSMLLWYMNHSYSWVSGFEQGNSKLTFDGIECKTEELWRVVNDGEPNAEYYIDGNQVTHEDFLKYMNENPKTIVEFSPLEVSWWKPIPQDKG